MKLDRIVFFISTVGIAIWLRLYFLHQPGYINDINSFLAWGNQIKSSGFWSLYSHYAGYLDYPPLVPIITSWWLKIGEIFKFENPFYFFKILPTIFEVALVIISASYVLRSKAKYKEALLAVIIIQPALSLITSAWGQVDSILVLLMILGYLLVDKNEFIGTALMFLALLTKPQALIGVFVYFVYLLLHKGAVNFLKQAGFFAVLIAAAFLIFKTKDADFFSVYFLSSSRYQYLSVNAFNLWWLLKGAPSFDLKDTATSGISARTLGLTFFAAFSAPALFYLWKKAKKIPEVLLVVSYFYLAFFVFLTQMHERYLYPAVALLAISAILNKKIFWVYLILTATLFLNCFAVLQSTFPQFTSIIHQNMGNLLTANWTRAAAAVNVIVALYLALYFAYESLQSS